jgi:hypothetical protein
MAPTNRVNKLIIAQPNRSIIVNPIVAPIGFPVDFAIKLAR